MSDLIKREDAIKAVVNTPSNIADVMGNNLCLDGAVFRQNEIIDILNGIPSAEPTVDKDYLVNLIQEAVYDGEACKRLMERVDRPQGEWITEEKDSIYGKKIRLKCSECGDTFDVSEKAFPYERFCRYCGADMRKGAEDA